MSACLNTEACPFFNDRMTHMPEMASMYKERYCKNEYSACARWQVSRAVGRENVPSDLYPNQRERVQELVA